MGGGGGSINFSTYRTPLIARGPILTGLCLKLILILSHHIPSVKKWHFKTYQHF